jgi:hypothetical protein
MAITAMVLGSISKCNDLKGAVGRAPEGFCIRIAFGAWCSA